MGRLPGSDLALAVLARLRAAARALFRRERLEREMREEFDQHIALRAADLARHGVAADEASHQARREFGRIDAVRDSARESRGLRTFDEFRFSWLDLKLALRMLGKHPLLSLAAIFALGVGIPVGLAPAHVARALEAPLPGDGDGRLRAIRHWDPEASRVAPTGYDLFEHWSRELQGFEALAAFRPATYRVAVADERASIVDGAAMSGTAFALVGRAPLHGRLLTPADAEPGAPAVVVLGHELWRSRFNADPAIVGRSIRVAAVPHTVVGVMPDGYRFPSQEQLWVSLRAPTVGTPEHAAPVRIIGRLADGISDEAAQAELTATPALPRDADAGDDPTRAMRAEVVPFGLLFLGLPAGGLDALPEFRLVQLLMYVLLLVACGNVAMLVFARTATRFREMAIRTALGASRARIVSQVFAEALVLALIAATVGLWAVDWLVGHVNVAAIAGESALPYWLSLGATPRTLAFAVVLAALSATVAGVVPAIAITGRAVHQNIRGRSGMRFGGWTGALVTADVAVSVAAVGMALAIGRQAQHIQRADDVSGIPAGEYLAVEFRMADEGHVGDSRDRQLQARAAAQRALVAAIAAEPGVQGVAVGDALPRMEHRSAPVLVDQGSDGAEDRARWVRTARVDLGFLRALSARPVAGRDFIPADLEGERARVIVNTAFIDRVLDGRDPIGRRIGFPDRAGAGATRWYEIVGVVPHLGVNMISAENGAAVYFPVAPGELSPLQVGIHVGASPLRFVPRLRELVAVAAPDFVPVTVSALDEVRQGDWYLLVGISAGLLVLVGVLVAMAASSLFAMLSLAVSDRTREIGIRAALGASRASLVLLILRRSLVQVVTGAVLGFPVAAFFAVQVASGAPGEASAVASLAGAVALAVGMVAGVALLSSAVPVRRIIAIEASEAMRAES